jgi:hypothetical protein
MAINNRRNRVVLFRLTQDEYESLRTASSVEGARSFSDFARTKLLRGFETPSLDAQLTELKTSVAHIAELLAQK